MADTTETLPGLGASAEELDRYEKLGLLPGGSDERLRRIGIISALSMAGVSLETVAANPALMDESAAASAERMRLMKKERFRQLEDLHAKQQKLDRLDRMIREIKNCGSNSAAAKERGNKR